MRLSRFVVLSLLAAGPLHAVPKLTLTPFGTGLTEPVALANAGDIRLFAVERSGKIKIVRSDGTVDPVPFIQIFNVSTSGEGGLLGLAFHPDYASNGYFYVHYTNGGGVQNRSRISRF